MAHPETERMLGHIKSGYITGLIFSKLARLARNTRELLDFADLFREHDADLISLQEAIDTTTPAGRLFYTMIAAMAQWEREEISERVAASVPIRAKLGKPLGGKAPFGYWWVEKKLVPDPKEVPLRKLIYELFLEHRRKKRVARLLNEAGHRTRAGISFSGTTVGRLIRDPTAKGLYRANYSRTGHEGGIRRFLLKPKEEWVWSKVEPIVSEELWEQCNAILDEQNKPGKLPAKPRRHLFSGFAFCTCGTKMYVPSRTKKYTCEKCRNKIPTEDLEAVFQAQLKQFLFSPKDIAECLTQADQVLKDKEALLRSLEAEQEKVKGEMDKVYRAYIQDEISVESYGRQYRPLEERLKQLEDEIPRLQGELDFLKIQGLSRNEILSEAQDLSSRWPDLGEDEKRRIVETITEKVTIGKDEISINLCYLPPSPANVPNRSRAPPGRSPG